MHFYRSCTFICMCLSASVSLAICKKHCLTFQNPYENLREVVIGKCTVYQRFYNPSEFCETDTWHPINCTDVWEKFSSAFLYQPLCNVPADRYDAYTRLTEHPTQRDKALFWENVYPFVDRFSNKGAHFVTLADTLTGYIADGLYWCSDPSLGMLESSADCPSWESTPECPQSAQRAFWIAASKAFGQRASGHIHIMLNATVNPIYADTTYFAVYELPHLTKDVSHATVLLLNENPIPNRTKCTDPSLTMLANQMSAKGIQYDCVENRRYQARDCLDIWKAFARAFRDEPRCNVSQERFSDYIALTDHNFPKDKGLFWDGVYPFVMRYSNGGAKFVALGDTLPGYIMSYSKFCGDPVQGIAQPPALCPEDATTPTCPQPAYRAFWIAASVNYARKARGHVHILLNASNSPVYPSDSYLALHEVPHMVAKKVTILLLVEHPEPNKDICKEDESIRSLKRQLRKRDIENDCVENRDDVMALFCLDNPESDVCQS